MMSDHHRRRRWLKRGAWAFGVMLFLALFIIPKVVHVQGKTRAKQQEAALPNLLGAMRAAIASFHVRHGRYPRSLREPEFVALLRAGEADLPAGSPGYAFDSDGIPRVDLFFQLGHPISSEVEMYPFRGAKGAVDPAKLKDTGHWLYEPETGRLLFDCTHKPAVARWAPLGDHPIYEW